MSDAVATEAPIGGALQSEVLEDLSSAVNYQDWVAALAEPWLGDTPIEVGSGRGDYAARWARTGRRLTASEADARRLAQLRERFAGDERVRVRGLVAPIDEDADHSAAVALNVLEHIEDDVAAVRSLSRLVHPGGHVVLLVPALMIAMSRFDRAIGHFRRYRRRQVEDVLRAAGLEPVVVRYVNPVGLLAWIVLVRLLRRAPRDGLLLRAYDRLVVPLLRWLDARVTAPVGQSVFAVARVPAPGGPPGTSDAERPGG